MNVYKRVRVKADGSKVEDPFYTGRYSYNGERKLIKLGTNNKEEAEKLLKKLVAELETNRIPGLLNQVKRRRELTLTQILADYLAADCPDSQLHPRAGAKLDAMKRQFDALAKWWGPKHPDHISMADCDDYWTWRKANVTKGTGDRTTELELCALSNALNWAVRTRRIEYNKLGLQRPTYRDAKKIRHCRDCMPASGDELHLLADTLFSSEQSETLGGQLLLEALTGCRTSEVLGMRWDAKRTGTTAEPGFFDDKYLYVDRLKGGINPYIVMTEPLKAFLQAWRAWHCLRFPESPYFFPSYWKKGKGPVDPTSLVHALERVTSDLRLGKRTSHGLRAFYVTVRRSKGIADAIIASELGQSSGAAQITSTYGAVPPNWHGGPELDFMPLNRKPAWEKWLQNNVIPLDRTA